MYETVDNSLLLSLNRIKYLINSAVQQEKLLNAYQRKNVSFVGSIGTCDVELVLNRGRRFELTLGNMLLH
jgi:hypothetical protein